MLTTTKWEFYTLLKEKQVEKCYGYTYTMQHTMLMNGVKPYTALMLPKSVLPVTCKLQPCILSPSSQLCKAYKRSSTRLFQLCLMLDLCDASSYTNLFLPLPCYFKFTYGAWMVTKEMLQTILLMSYEWKAVSFESFKHFCLKAFIYH